MHLLALVLGLGAQAQQPPINPFREPDESELFRFQEELVTVASRYEQTVRKAPSIVTLVTAEEIRTRGYRTVADLLRDLPGIYLYKSTEGRDLAGIRGVLSADNNKLLVLVDGQPWYDGVYTHGWIGDALPIGNIRQVEVIKGPGSAIYGTNAFAGVVNIVTWRPEDLDGARVRWSAGSVGRSDLVASAGGASTVGGTRVAVATYARVLSQLGDGLDVVPSGERDILGHDPKKSVNIGGRLEIADLTLQLHHLDYRHTFLRGELDDPNDALGKTLDTFDLEYANTFASARYALDLGTDLALAPHAWAQRHDNPGAYFLDNGFTTAESAPGVFETVRDTTTVETEKDTTRWGLGLDIEARPALDHVLVAGLGLESVDVVALYDAEIAFGEHRAEPTGFAAFDSCGRPVGLPRGGDADCSHPKLRNLYGYGQYTWTALPSLELTGGARVDKRIPVNEGENASDGAFVLSVSPRLGLLLVPSDSVTAKLLYGRAFRAPSVREVLVVSTPDPDTGDYEFASGNVNLLPETVQTVEAEVTSVVAKGVELRADGSFSQLDNEIDKVNPPNKYCNIPGHLAIVGAEAGARIETGPARLGLDYALTSAKYTGSAEVDPTVCPEVAWNEAPYAGRTQYEFPPHMLKGRAGVELIEQLDATLVGELYSARPRSDWSPDAGLNDGSAFGLLHATARMRDLGPDGRVEAALTVRNLLGAEWSMGNYRDDANVLDGSGAEFGNPVQGEGRAVLLALEVDI